MTVSEILTKYNLSLAELSRRSEIPLRTLENWKAGTRKAPEYVLKLLDKCLQYEAN